MIIGAGQQVCHPVVYPLFALMPLAFRAVTITAAIIADAEVTTAIAHIYMPAQCCCAALFNSPERLLLMNAKRKGR
jgi:hypothetical protein